MWQSTFLSGFATIQVQKTQQETTAWIRSGRRTAPMGYGLLLQDCRLGVASCSSSSFLPSSFSSWWFRHQGLTPCSVASSIQAIFNRLGRTKFLPQLIGLALRNCTIDLIGRRTESFPPPLWGSQTAKSAACGEADGAKDGWRIDPIVALK